MIIHATNSKNRTQQSQENHDSSLLHQILRKTGSHYIHPKGKRDLNRRIRASDARLGLQRPPRLPRGFVGTQDNEGPKLTRANHPRQGIRYRKHESRYNNIRHRSNATLLALFSKDRPQYRERIHPLDAESARIQKFAMWNGNCHIKHEYQSDVFWGFSR